MVFDILIVFVGGIALGYVMRWIEELRRENE